MNIQAAAAQLQRFAQFLSAAREIEGVLKVAAAAEASVEGLTRTQDRLRGEIELAGKVLKDLHQKHDTQLKAGLAKIERKLNASKEHAKEQIKKLEDSVRGVAARAIRLSQEAEIARQDRDDALTYRQAEIEESGCVLARLQTAAAQLQERIAGLSG